MPLVNATPCFGGFDFGACIPPLDESYLVPAMKYEHHPEGLYLVLKDFGERWPKLRPMAEIPWFAVALQVVISRVRERTQRKAGAT